MRHSLSYYLGNSLILLSLLGFLSIGYPVISAYLLPSHMPTTGEQENMLWIPKIKAAGKVIPNVNPWNEKEYKDALHHGIALAKGFAHPGEHGTIYLFAHSSGMPWEQTRYNTVFLRLNELERGDTIIFWYGRKEFTYHVTEKKEVNPSDVQALTKANADQLVIQTCTPIGTDWKRLLVYAKEVKE